MIFKCQAHEKTRQRNGHKLEKTKGEKKSRTIGHPQRYSLLCSFDGKKKKKENNAKTRKKNLYFNNEQVPMLKLFS